MSSLPTRSSARYAAPRRTFAAGVALSLAFSPLAGVSPAYAQSNSPPRRGAAEPRAAGQESAAGRGQCLGDDEGGRGRERGPRRDNGDQDQGQDQDQSPAPAPIAASRNRPSTSSCAASSSSRGRTATAAPQQRRAHGRAGLGLHHRSERLHRHQQPRRRERRQGDGDLPGRQQASGEDHRPRHQDRSRAPEDRRAASRCPTCSWGDSNAEQVGDWVLAVGNPFGLGGTVSSGIISARGRDIHSGPYDDFLQIDAVDQPRQFRRPDLQSRRRGDRHQHRDLFAQWRLGRHRLRHPVEPRQAGDRSAARARQGRARLARRADPGGDAGDRQEPAACRKTKARSSPT